MSTIKQIINRVDAVKPNAFDLETKMAWLTELDGKIAADLFLMNIADIRQLECRNAEHEALVGYPHEDIYDHYLAAKIDMANGEYDKYQNSMAMYNASYSNFACWFLNTYDPAQGYRGEEI